MAQTALLPAFHTSRRLDMLDFVKFFHCVYVHEFCISEGLYRLGFGGEENAEWLLKINWNYEGEYPLKLRDTN